MSKKETFQTDIEKQLEEWKAQIAEHSSRIEELKIKAEKLEGEAKLQYLEQIKEIENKMEAVIATMTKGESRLVEIKEAGEEAWAEVKDGSQSAWNDLVVGVNTAWGEVKDSFEAASSKIQDHVSKK